MTTTNLCEGCGTRLHCGLKPLYVCLSPCTIGPILDRIAYEREGIPIPDERFYCSVRRFRYIKVCSLCRLFATWTRRRFQRSAAEHQYANKQRW